MPDKKPNILIVEDEFIIAKMMEVQLTTSGYSVAGVAANSKDAIDIAKSQNPDLILMDIQLQNRESGTKLAEEIYPLIPVPIIFATGNSDESTRKNAENAPGFAGFLVKPVNKDTLIKAIQEALDLKL